MSERVLIVPRWANDLARDELGRDLTPEDVPPPGYWDRIEVAADRVIVSCPVSGDGYGSPWARLIERARR